MHIALVIKKFNLRNNNELSLMVSDMASSFVEKGHDITIIAGEVLGLPKHLPYEVIDIALPKTNPSWQLFSSTIHSFLAQHQYDIIHAVTPIESCDVYQPLSGFLPDGIKNKIPTLCSGVKSKIQALEKVFKRKNRAELESQEVLCQQRSGTTLVAFNQFIVKQLNELYQISDDNIDIIGYGLKLNHYIDDDTKQKGAHLKKLYDRNNDTTLFIYITENFQVDGFGWLLDAVTLANSAVGKTKSFKILVVTSLDYAPQYKQVALRDLTDQILFMGDSNQRAVLYHMSDGVILPTYYNSCSRVVLESLATNTPVITTRCDGASDLITSKVQGHVITLCGNVEALANAILDLCGDNSEQRMNDALSAKIRDGISMSHCCDRLVVRYQEIMAEKQRVQMDGLR